MSSHSIIADMARGIRFVSGVASIALLVSGLTSVSWANETAQPDTPAPAASSAAPQEPTGPAQDNNDPADNSKDHDGTDSSGHPDKPNQDEETTKPDSGTTNRDEKKESTKNSESASSSKGSSDIKPVDGFDKITLADAASVTTDKKVIDALNEILEIQGRAMRVTQNLEKSNKAQKEAEKKLSQAEDQLSIQQKKVDDAKVSLGLIAMSQQQGHETMATANVLLKSEDAQGFLSKLATMRNVGDITNEQLRRSLSECERLADLKTIRKELTQKAADEVNRQKALKAEYEAKIKQAEEVLEKLSPGQLDLLKKLNDTTIKNRTSKLLEGSLAEGDFDLSGVTGLPTGKGQGIWPASGPITSPFGYRVNPVVGFSELHDGTDIGAPCGAPVQSAWPGVVISARYQRGYGNRVLVDSGMYKATYNHLSGFAVQPGQTVKAGQLIGTVGTTGWSTGCHLHFSTWVNGQIADPTTIF